MLRPSGSACSTSTSAPARAQRARPDVERRAVGAVDARRAARRACGPSSAPSRCATYASTPGSSAASHATARATRRGAGCDASAFAARLRSRPRRRRRACGRRRPTTFTPLSVHGLWLAETIAAGHAARCGEERDRRASAATPSEHDATPFGAEPAASVGLDARTRLARVAPDERTRSAPSTRAAARPSAMTNGDGEIGVGVAADAVGAEPQHARRRRATASSTAAPCGPS